MIERTNNFDLIRLLAAFQVVIGHCIGHFGVEFAGERYLSLFPGIIIFFSISGFLISYSFDRNRHSLKKYFINRFLRIYPALWFCFLFTLFTLYMFGVIHGSVFMEIQFIAWIIAQISCFQFYTADILRGWGVGCPNGSLWTIPVEIGFYVLLPLLLMKVKRKNWMKVILFSFFVSVVANVLIYMCLEQVGSSVLNSTESMIENRYLLLLKILSVSTIPYLFFFLIGAMMYFYWERIRQFVEGKFLYWLIGCPVLRSKISPRF